MINLNYIDGIPFDYRKFNKEIYLLPIKGVHTEEQVKEAKISLDAKYLDFEVYINWQEQ